MVPDPVLYCPVLFEHGNWNNTVQYVLRCCLCREGDRGRLREVFEELLTDRARSNGAPNSKGGHILRTVVLPVVARARTCDSLVDEFVSLLDDEL